MIGASERAERSLIVALDLAPALEEGRRRDIVRETKDGGLESARRSGTFSGRSGRAGGRHPAVDDDKCAVILARRERGESIRAIAAGVKVLVGAVHETVAEQAGPQTDRLGSANGPREVEWKR